MAPTGKILVLISIVLMPVSEAIAAKGLPEWKKILRSELRDIETSLPKNSFGVFVRDISSGAELSYRGEETWYLASGVKLAIACAVLKNIEAGRLSRHKKIHFKHSDRVDGTGETNFQPDGSALSIDFLMRQMLVFSDNTASDLLIKEVGLKKVNKCVRPFGFERITSLADVRRHAFSFFHPKAWQLQNSDYLKLGTLRKEQRKIRKLSALLAVPFANFQAKTIHEAFSSYYAKGLNSASLRSYADFLSEIVNGKLLSKKSTKSLLGIMKEAKTGSRRIIAGLPRRTEFAHKTGTQVERVCDLGVAWNKSKNPIVIAACTRGFASSAKAERVLRKVGRAVAKSGVLAQ